MRYLGQEELYILAECEECGKEMKIEKTLMSEIATGYLTNSVSSKIVCSCGKSSISIEGKPYSKGKPVFNPAKDVRLKCPKCGSTNLTANTKGFGLGKAAVGGILLGPVGLLGGLFGSRKAVFICLKCGDQFEK